MIAATLSIPPQCYFYTQLHRPGGDYVRDITADFAMIEPYLPAEVSTIIDIGCGMAGIDVMLKNKYPAARLSLLDGDGDKPTYGWNARCAPYSSRAAAEALLTANGYTTDEWLDPGTNEELNADLVISLLSWGFHYPLSTYKVRGFCIADLNKRHELPRGRVIWDAAKSNRCAFTC